jgi:predicted nucleic acid-binding protein
MAGLLRVVIDNSMVMRWLFGDGASADLDYAERIPGIMQKDGSVAMVPAVWPLEVGNVIVRAKSRNLLAEARGAEFLALLQDMAFEIEFRGTERALTDTLQLARRHKLPTYEASCLELALREGVPLATNDADLRKALARTGGKLA